MALDERILTDAPELMTIAARSADYAYQNIL